MSGSCIRLIMFAHELKFFLAVAPIVAIRKKNKRKLDK